MQKKKKNQKEKKNQKFSLLSKKEKRIFLIRYSIITIVLAILAYALATFVTTQIVKNIRKTGQTEDVHNILENMDTSSPITVADFIDTLNQTLKEKKLSYQIEGEYQRNPTFYQYTIDKEKRITLYLEPVQKQATQKAEILSMSAIFVPNQNKDEQKVQQLFTALLLANEHSLTEDEMKQLIKNVEDKEQFKEENGIKTSEFYQYKGLEISMRITETETSYRVGRIMG